jgi:hypothetical protein
MSSSALLEERSRPAEAVVRLLVSWQNPSDRSFHPIGFLDCAETGYTFNYLKAAPSTPGFFALLGFADFDRTYRSHDLFPLFAERVMDPLRPDRVHWLESLGLESSAGVMEVLARSGGIRSGDTLELSPVPDVDAAGRTSTIFLVHGVRYCPGATERIAKLQVGDELLLVDDAANEKDARAVLVTERDKTALGWVPSPLLDYIHDARRHGPSRVVVERANLDTVDPHLRLLVRFEGQLRLGDAPFSGASWRLMSSGAE